MLIEGMDDDDVKDELERIEKERQEASVRAPSLKPSGDKKVTPVSSGAGSSGDGIGLAGPRPRKFVARKAEGYEQKVAKKVGTTRGWTGQGQEG